MLRPYVSLVQERLSEAEAAFRSNRLVIRLLASGSEFNEKDLWNRAMKCYESAREEPVESGSIGEMVEL